MLSLSFAPFELAVHRRVRRSTERCIGGAYD